MQVAGITEPSAAARPSGGSAAAHRCARASSVASSIASSIPMSVTGKAFAARARAMHVRATHVRVEVLAELPVVKVWSEPAIPRER